MAFTIPTIKKTEPDIKNLSIYLRSVKKWGKSTLFRDTVLYKYGDPACGVLFEVGMERGDALLGANTTHLDTYADLIEAKKWLIKGKGKEHNIQLVAFDTADELVPLFEAEVVRRYNSENPTKPLKSIKAVYGGYNAGAEKAASMIKSFMDEIKMAGFGVWVIAHTKFKNIKEKGNVDDEGYMQLTSNLGSTYESAFGDIFDVTVTGVIDRAIEKKVGADGKGKNYSTDSIRKLYFRGTTLVDAGGRFKNGTVPEYIVFDKSSEEFAKEFVDTVENGIKLSVPSTPISKDNTFNKVVDSSKNVDDLSIDETVIEETSDDTVDKDELMKEIRAAFKSADKDIKLKVKNYLTENADGKLSNSLTIKQLLEIKDIL